MSGIPGSHPDDEYEDATPDWRKRIMVVVIIVAIVVGVGWFELSYERGVVSTTVETGTITKINDGAVSFSAAIPGVAPSQAQTAATSSVVITVNGVTFTQTMPCSTPPYKAGQSVQVDNNLLRSGTHEYVPNVACKGFPSPFKGSRSTQTTTSTSTSTTSTTSTSATSTSTPG